MSVKLGIFYIYIIYIYISILKRLVATHKPGRTIRSMMNHADLTKKKHRIQLFNHQQCGPLPGIPKMGP